MDDKVRPLSTSLIIPLSPPLRLDDVSSLDIVDMEQSKLVCTYKGALILRLSVEELQSSLVVDPIVLLPCAIFIPSEVEFLSFNQGDVGHKLVPNLDPN